MNKSRVLLVAVAQGAALVLLVVIFLVLVNQTTKTKEYPPPPAIPVGESFIGVGFCASGGFLTYCDGDSEVASVAQVTTKVDPTPQTALQRCESLSLEVPEGAELKAVFTGTVIECQIHFPAPKDGTSGD